MNPRILPNMRQAAIQLSNTKMQTPSILQKRCVHTQIKSVLAQAVNLDQYASDLAVILAIDWLLDRCRTAVNLLGDSYGVLVVDHLVK